MTLLKEVAEDIAYGLFNIQTEQSLVENEERYHFVVKGATDGFWDWNLLNNEVYFSPKYKAILGYSENELGHSNFKSWETYLHPDDKERTFLDIKMSHEGKTKRYQNIHRLKHKDGHWVWVESRAQTIFDTDAKAVRMIGSHTDITEKVVLEQELKNSYETLHKLVDNIPGAIYQYKLDSQGNASFPYANNGIKSIYEVSPEDVLKNADLVFKILHPDDLQMIQDSIQMSAQTLQEWNLKYRVKLPKKGLRWLQGKAKPERLKDGSTLWHGFITDISEEVLDKQKLLFQSQLLEQSIAATSVVDENTIFTYVNDAYVKMWGYTNKEDLLGTSPDNCCEDITMPQQIIEKVKKEGIHLFFYKAKRKDGSLFDVLMSVQCFAYMGKKHYLSSALDITENQENLRQLKQKKHELETIIQEAPNPMILHEEGGKILMLNQAWIDSSGFSREEIPTIYDWIEHIYDDEETRIFTKKHIDSLYKLTSKVDEGDFTFLNKNRDLMTWQFSSAPLGLLDGKHTVISTAMDITELKRKDKILITQSRHAAMGEMISMIAHQWRQPLSTISMDANNMLVDIAIDNFSISDSEKYANHIAHQTQHLSQTIDDFRNFFKPDKAISKVNIEDILNQTLSIVKDILNNSNIKFTSFFETQTEVEAYPRELMQVFVNIITNAQDVLVSTQTKNAFIIVRVYEDKLYVNVEICDNGGGIDASILAKIFDPYFSTKDEKTGTGLGLYMSKMIIEDHLQGIIEAHNNHDGACFTVKLLKKH